MAASAPCSPRHEKNLTPSASSVVGVIHGNRNYRSSMSDTSNSFPPSIGTPIRFKTLGLKGAVPEIDGVVDEILLHYAICVMGEDGTFWLVLEHELVCIYEVQ